MKGLVQHISQVSQIEVETATNEQWNVVMEIMQRQEDKLNMILTQFTITSYGQNMLRKAAMERVKTLLRGPDSVVYRKYARSYYFHLWADLKREFPCIGKSYRDLHAMYYNLALDYIKQWHYTSRN